MTPSGQNDSFEFIVQGFRNVLPSLFHDFHTVLRNVRKIVERVRVIISYNKEDFAMIKQWC